MKEYVIVLPIISGTKYMPMIVKGNTINLPGGVVESNESITDKALKKLKDETGLDGYDAVIAGSIEVNECVIYCVYCSAKHPINSSQQSKANVEWGHWDNIKNDPRLIQDLKLVIPMLRLRTVGWSVFKTNDMNVMSIVID